VRTRVAEEKKEKRAQMKVAQESFRKMLEELGDKITYKTTYEDVKELCRDDERWKTLDSKEREAVINEFIAPLKEQHKKGTCLFIFAVVVDMFQYNFLLQLRRKRKPNSIKCSRNMAK